MTATRFFWDKIATLNDYSVLEIGTRRWGDKPTHSKNRFTLATKYIMGDFMDGKDVDVIVDIHELSKVFGENSFDVFYCSAVFEHVQKPWIAAKEIHKILKPRGVFFIQTHFAFPLHGYPNDYYRYTTDGMLTLFEDFKIKHSEFMFPAQIHSERDPGGKYHPAWLNVIATGEK